MKPWLAVALIAVGAPALAQELGKAGEPAAAIPYESVPSFLKLPPDL